MAPSADGDIDLATSAGLAADHAPRAVAFVQEPGHVLRYVNPAFCRLFGKNRDALLGREVPEVLPQVWSRAAVAMLARVGATGEAASERDVEGPAGRDGPVHLTFTAWPLAAAGRAAWLVVEVADTTDRVRARRRAAETAAELREVNQELMIAGMRERALAAQAEVAKRRAAFLAEASVELARSLDVDAALAALARVAVPEVADLCVVDLVDAQRPPRRVAAVHADSTAAGVLAELDRPWPLATGDEHPMSRLLRTGRAEWVADLADPMPAAGACDAGTLAHLRACGVRGYAALPLAARDRLLGVITFVATGAERRLGPDDLALAEELVRRAALAAENARLLREAQDAVRARDAFLARASHELRTPLTSAVGALRLLERAMDGRLREWPDDLVQIASRSLDTMLVLINDLLDASKLAAGAESLVLDRVDLDASVRRALEVVSGHAREKGVTVHVAVPSGLAARADAIRLEQVLVNLLANAVAFTPAGGLVSIEGAADAAAAGAVLVRVRDTGDGIAAEHLERVFEPFFQTGRPHGRRPRGTGLGLAICRQIVTLHGGAIWAESGGPGCGSTFSVRLPGAPAAQGRAA